ncbi:MAG: hypothetical protein V4615_16830 [Bacteroidota bacterium]
MNKLFLFGIISSLLIFSCKKDLRTKVYPLRAYNNSGVTGQVSFIETKAKDTTIVKLEAHGLKVNTVYLTHLHTGKPGNLTGTLIYFTDIQTSNGNVERDESWNESFDDALNSNTSFTVHDPAFFSNDTIGYVLAGNTGINAR